MDAKEVGTMTTGERIRERRRALNMTQAELAKAINVTYQLISNYEHNVVTDIPASKIRLLANALDCHPLWLSDGVLPEEGLTLEQLKLIEIVKSASREQVAQIFKYALFVVSS
jgi:transcriptional regulator with XRE-family HTH domain